MSKIALNNVKYLAFEGGGGKGLAYLGAAMAFSDPAIGIFKKPLPSNYVFVNELKIGQDINNHYLDINKIKGVSGSSAGAITAGLIGCQVPLETLIKELLSTERMSKNKVWDKPDYLKREIVSIKDKNDYIEEVNRSIFASYVAIRNAMIPLLLGEENWILFADNLRKDYGVISGNYLMQLFNNLIKDNFPLIKRKGTMVPANWLTFKEHYEALNSKFELILTGSHLEDSRLQYFSYATTPNLPIVVAMRISMGFPGAFSAVIINDESFKGDNTFSKEEKDILKGTWVDGGLKNNFPIHAFRDHIPSRSTHSIMQNVLGLRLGLPKKKIINDVTSHFGAVLDTLISNITELNIDNQDEREKTITLPTSVTKMGYGPYGIPVESRYELSTLQFEPIPEIVVNILPEDIAATFNYFNISINQDSVYRLMLNYLRSDEYRKAINKTLIPQYKRF